MKYLFLAVLGLLLAPLMIWAQDIPSRPMIGGDVSLNINFFSSDRMLVDGGVLPDFEQDFLGNMQGTSLAGSVIFDFPAGSNQFIAVHATLEEIDLAKEGQLKIPCNIYDYSGKKIGPTIAMTNQSQTVSFTYLTLGADLLRQFGHGYASIGSALGPALKSGYSFSSHILEPDSCWYNFFGSSRSKTLHEESTVNNLSFRIPLTIRIGFLIPFADRTYLAPSIGVNFGFFPINESGSTVTSIQPGMGIRYMP
jgi:hypothetical protein